MSKQKLELTWIGKEKRPRLEPRILLEDAGKSYHAGQRVSEHDVFDNRLIFGDNLLALKALEAEFTGKVKCVFIDPPYNTGSAFTHYDDGLEHSIWLGLMRDRLEIIRRLHAEMMAHFWEAATGYEVQVSRGFTALRPCNYTVAAGQGVHHFRETVSEPGRIKQMLFGGFARCLYPLQKFDSDTERRFAVILERDALKWFKPAKGQFQMYYKLGAEQPEYVPDFVAETDTTVFMAETKARSELNTPEVRAKAAAAARWCKHASDRAAQVGGKPWKYLLIPHDEVAESKRLADFSRFEVADVQDGHMLIT